MINLDCPITLYKKQHEAFWNDYRVSVIEGSTKSGKSVGGVLWIIDKAILGKKNEIYWCVSPIFAQAKILYRRAKSWLPPSLVTCNESELTIEINGAGKIFFKSAQNSDSLYGEDVHAALIDEASRCSEAAFTAVRSTVTATQGQIRAVGNVKGRGNWFYKISRRAQQAMKREQKDYYYTKLTAADAVASGVLAKEEILSAKRDLPDAVFKELYFCIASDDQGNPFCYKSIKSCTKKLSTKEPKYFGCDIASTADGGDATVIVGLDEDGAVALVETMRVELPDVTDYVCKHLSNKKLIMDATGLGRGVFQTLARQSKQVEPFVYNNSNKQQLMEMLAAAIRNKEISFPDGEIVNELNVFEYTHKNLRVFYNAPEGYFDDHVNALALAWKCYVDNRPRIRSAPAKKTIVHQMPASWNKLDHL